MKNKEENSENEVLRKIAPTLFNIEKKNNLKAPEGYFDNFSNTIIDKVKDEAKLNIPDDYFENLSDKIMDMIKNQSDTKLIFIKRKKLIRSISIAASIAAIFIVTFLLNINTIEENQLTSNEYSLNELTVEGLEEAMFSSENVNLICYVDFEDETPYNLEINNDLNEIDLDITSSEIDDYLSSDYYFDVEF